jgi:hypothetical protein
MKSTTRGTLAAAITGVATAVGAGAAPPAVAADTVPVSVPLGGVEKALNVQMPELGGRVPLVTPGRPDGPRYVEGRLLPANTLPQVPLDTALPGVSADTPLPRVADEGFEHATVHAPAADLTTQSPGLSADTPLTAPNPELFGLPTLKAPQADVLTPLLRTAPTANLGLA